jgi:hypothetical protein
VSELRKFVRAHVPTALVPQSFVELHDLPRKGTGEVDIARLPDPFAPTDTYVEPRTPTEREIANIWGRLLGLERVGIHDNFLDIGGHSLVGIRALLQIEKQVGVRLHPNALTLQTLEQIAAECDREIASRESEESNGDRGLGARLLTAVRHSVSRG